MKGSARVFSIALHINSFLIPGWFSIRPVSSRKKFKDIGTIQTTCAIQTIPATNVIRICFALKVATVLSLLISEEGATCIILSRLQINMREYMKIIIPAEGSTIDAHTI